MREVPTTRKEIVKSLVEFIGRAMKEPNSLNRNALLLSEQTEGAQMQ